ncbi:VOC family protein [Mammaliicoccus sciuri]|uniref:VOC family protein n=1 Tax=Mammaliicoccus sciuri TaxID=1296 RepID=UPI001FB3B23D|nr:VOC family protein [Mammaliicoccus sciuri]MCJ1778403.1 VOC family protein [Mammaliicoccus sciuri]
MNHNSIIHHVSIINHDAEESFDFYRNILGLNLLMKTVNQENYEMYHVFFADKYGRPGTEVTLFEMKEGKDNQFGANAFDRLLFKVPSVESLKYWEARFDEYEVCHYGIEVYTDRSLIRFEGPDNTPLGLIVISEQEDVHQFNTDKKSTVPVEYQILGLDSIHARVRYPKASIEHFQSLYNWTSAGQQTFFDTDLSVEILHNRNQDMYHEIHFIYDTFNPLEDQGFGGIHHVAISAEDEGELQEVETALDKLNMVHSPIKNRGFFKSIYYRDPNQLLFEVATLKLNMKEIAFEDKVFQDIPLYLPEHLEEKRAYIEKKLRK